MHVARSLIICFFWRPLHDAGVVYLRFGNLVRFDKRDQGCEAQSLPAGWLPALASRHGLRLPSGGRVHRVSAEGSAEEVWKGDTAVDTGGYRGVDYRPGVREVLEAEKSWSSERTRSFQIQASQRPSLLFSPFFPSLFVFFSIFYLFLPSFAVECKMWLILLHHDCNRFR